MYTAHLFLFPLGLETTTAAILLYKSQILRFLTQDCYLCTDGGPSRGLRFLNPARPLYPRFQNPMLTVFENYQLSIKRLLLLLTIRSIPSSLKYPFIIIMLEGVWRSSDRNSQEVFFLQVESCPRDFRVQTLFSNHCLGSGCASEST